MSSDYEEREEAPVQRVNGGIHGFNLNRYAGEVADNVWTPDPIQPEEQIHLALFIRALTGEHLNGVQQQFHELRRLPNLIAFQQEKLERCKPPYDLERKQKQLSEVDEADFTADSDPNAEGYQSATDKATARRLDLEQQIKTLNDGWEDKHIAIQNEIDRLLALANVSAYELLRGQLFSHVIQSHDIYWNEELLDFSKPAEEGKEPPDTFAGALYLHIVKVLGDEKKAKRRSNGSVGQSKRPA